jgi:hypothetical protein
MALGRTRVDDASVRNIHLLAILLGLGLVALVLHFAGVF